MIELLIIIICICILATQVYIQDWRSVIIFITILSLCHYVMKLDTYIAFGLAGILACLMNLFSRMRLESFSNEDDVVDEDDEDDDDDDANGDAEDNGDKTQVHIQIQIHAPHAPHAPYAHRPGAVVWVNVR